MRPVAVTPLNGFVGDEPGVAAAANAVGCRAPAGDVRLVLIGHAQRQAIELRRPERREMKDELLAVVQEAIAVDRLVVADREVAGEARSRASRFAVDGDRL